MNKENSIDQLKFFLKEMFQFNSNDLDFGIYRIYNLKRKEIENFIDGKDEQCLEPIINKTLELVSNIEKQVELTSLTAYLKKFNQESLVNDPAANFKEIQLLIDFSKDDLEKESLTAALTASTKEFNITDEIKDKIYNHILGYFEMYYSNGDFGYNNRSRNLYKVPYEADYDGNDTMFHWKHKGSLYIKTGTSFNAIKFKLKHLDAAFELRLETNEESTNEDVARNNNKDTKLKHYKFNRFEEKDGITRIVFNLSDASTTKADLFKSLFKEVFKSKANLDNYLFAKNDKGELKPIFNDLTDDYDKVQDGSVKGIGALRVNRKTILGKVNKNFEKGAKVEIIDDCFSDETLETIYNIDQKLNSFYIGNDSDYFIHENLQEFLTQEKERYIKNHILSDLKSILDGKLDNTTLIIAKAFELVSSRIIEFLSAIEEFQKKLFTMKKKVVESEYCLTIDNIDEKHYKEILENKAQLAEWETLFSVKVKTLDDLKAQPTLVLDTKFFKQKDGSNPFKDKILAEIENLDERTNGLLINSENYQGLHSIQNRFSKQFQTVYIDPPYNTDASPIIYKNHFRSSSWISLLENRVKLSHQLISDTGVLCATIDDFQQKELKWLLEDVFGADNFLGLVAIRNNPSGRPTPKGLAISHEYGLFCRKKSPTTIGKLPRTEKLDSRYKEMDSDGKFMWELLRKRGSDSERKDSPKAYFPFYFNGKKLRIPEMEWIEKSKNWTILEEAQPNEVVLYPIDENGVERRWRWGIERAKNEIDELKVEVKGKEYIIYYKYRPPVGVSPTTNWVDSKYSATEHGTGILKPMFKGYNPFSYPKSLYAVKDCIYISGMNKPGSVCLDYFAGSATTGHAVISINKDEDDNSRKYVLIEMGAYFDTVTKPRIQKVIYSENWENGEPIDNNGSLKHIFKYIVLEQYEDVLDAITTKEEIEKTERLLEKLKNERYLIPLKYIYKPELNKINSTLDLSKPFSNKIKYGQPTKEGFIDLVDTYNYLQGYEVKSIKTYTIGKKFYKVVETADTLVVWRDIALGEDDSKAIKEIAEKYPEATQIEVNYDFNLLATLKDKQIEVGKRLLSLTVIHSDIFNQ